MSIMIHHATKKKLGEKGIIIQETPDGSNFKYSSNWQDPEGKRPEIELWGDNIKVLGEAMVEARMSAIEHHLQFDQNADNGSIEITVGIERPRVVGKVELIDDLASAIPDVLEALTSGEADEIAEADAADAQEEDEARGSVVPAEFKRRYAEAGHPNTCGDWLAMALDPLVTGKNGKLDPDAMEEIAGLNSVDTSRLNRTTPGWQGRFRMTARNMLVKVVAAQGFLLVPSVEGDPTRLAAPSEWLLVNQPKVKEAGDKRAARKTKGA